MEKRAARLLALREIKNYGSKKILDLIGSYGSVEKAYLTAINNNLIKENIIQKYEKIIDDCKKDNIHIVTYFDQIYPANLKKISSLPLVLFAKGNLNLLNMPSISIIGTRLASKKSLEWTYSSSKTLSDLGFVIVSGGAIGIDSSAHRGALDSAGNTICVLGSGINNIYPKENIPLINSIFERGLVISENIPNQNVNRFNLLERNRITSGIGNKLLLVATKSNGGAMSQYKVALSQKKEIFCPSPELGLEPTEGINQIIKENKNIMLIKDIDDILNSSDLNKPSSQKILKTFA